MNKILTVESFHEKIVKYPNNTATIIGNIKIDDNSIENYLVGIFVDDQLRGKSNIMKFKNESWFNLSFQSNGNSETAKIVLLNLKVLYSNLSDLYALVTLRTLV